MEEFVYNRRIYAMKPSASMALMARAKQMQQSDPTVIGLAAGEPDFPTPDRICMEAIRAMAAGDTHYTPGPGLAELRERIAEKLAQDNGIRCSAEDILVTPGGKNAIFLSVNALLNPGDEVILLDPSWVSYEPIVLSAGGVPVHVHLDCRSSYRITREALEEAVTPRTRMLIINYPNNPTGRILSPAEADIMEAFLLAHPRVVLLSDEVYERIVFDGNVTVSMASRESVREHVITVNGFSKCAAMTGWRLGYLAAEKAFMEPIYKLHQHSASCVSGFIQRAAIVALDCKEEMDQMRRTYQMRRDLFVPKLNEIPGVHCQAPAGAFYAWVTFDFPGMDSGDVCAYLMDHAGVVGIPGSSFGEERVSSMRFSLANATEDMERSGERIKAALVKLQTV